MKKRKIALFKKIFSAFLLCIARESNHGLLCGRQQCYNWTTDAWFLSVLNVWTKTLLFISIFHRIFESKSWMIHFIWVLNISYSLSSFLFWQWNSNKLQKFKTALSSEIFSAMYRPEIGPGSIAWLATILPLNQRCLIYSILIVSTTFCPSIQFFFETSNKIMKNLFQSNWGFELSWMFW